MGTLIGLERRMARLREEKSAAVNAARAFKDRGDVRSAKDALALARQADEALADTLELAELPRGQLDRALAARLRQLEAAIDGQIGDEDEADEADETVGEYREALALLEGGDLASMRRVGEALLGLTEDLQAFGDLVEPDETNTPLAERIAEALGVLHEELADAITVATSDSNADLLEQLEADDQADDEAEEDEADDEADRTIVHRLRRDEQLEDDLDQQLEQLEADDDDDDDDEGHRRRQEPPDLDSVLDAAAARVDL